MLRLLVRRQAASGARGGARTKTLVRAVARSHCDASDSFAASRVTGAAWILTGDGGFAGMFAPLVSSYSSLISAQNTRGQSSETKTHAVASRPRDAFD